MIMARGADLTWQDALFPFALFSGIGVLLLLSLIGAAIFLAARENRWPFNKGKP